MSAQPCPWTPLGAFVVPNGQVGSSKDSNPLPAPVSGRVTAIVTDLAAPDQIVYAGTALGGVWQTNDGGITWTPLIDGQATLAVGALEFANGVLYVGTGEDNSGGDNAPGLGVMSITIAGGAITHDYQPQFAGQAISRMFVDSSFAPTVLYAATTNGFWQKALATGVWTEIPVAGVGAGQPISDALMTRGGRIYVGVARRGVFTLDTATSTLVRVPETVATLPLAIAAVSSGRVSLSACLSSPNTIYAAIVDSAAARGVQMFRCDNAADAPGGVPAASTWNVVTPPAGIELAWYTNVLAVHPHDPDVVYYGGTELFRSKDGGKKWESCTARQGSMPGSHADQHAVAIEPVPIATANKFNDVKLWLGNDGGVWRSTDGGTKWLHRNRGLNTMQYFAMATHPTARTIVAAGAQDNGTQRYLGDAAWELADYGDGCYVGFDPVAPTTWYNGYISYDQTSAAVRNGGFLGFKVSTQSGALGTYQTSAGAGATAIGAVDEALFYAPFIIVPPAGGAATPDIFVGTDTVYFSGNRGTTWTAITAFLLQPPRVINTRTRGVSALAAVPGVAGRLYVGTSDGLFYRVDQAGGVWSAAAVLTQPMGPPPPPPPPVIPAPTALEAAGMTRGSFISAIAATRLPNGNDQVYVAVGRNHIVGGRTAPLPGASHLFVSSDNGATFAPVVIPDVAVPGLPAPGIGGATNSVNALAIDPNNQNLLYIGCDVGVFQLDSATGVVTPWQQGLPNCVVMWLDIVNTAPRVLRAATHGRGSWETLLDAPGAPGPCPNVELFVRETMLDDGRSTPSVLFPPDPMNPGQTLSATRSLDILIEPGPLGEHSGVSTVDYTDAGPLDYIGFEQIDGRRKAARGDNAHVHVRIHNRGPLAATQVKVALHRASRDVVAPPLPANFFSTFPAGQPSGGNDWPAIDTVQTIARIGPGEAAVASFSWPVPSDIPVRERLLTAVSSAEDPFVDVGELDAMLHALKSRYVAITDAELASVSRAWIVALVAAGLIVGVGAALYLSQD